MCDGSFNANYRDWVRNILENKPKMCEKCELFSRKPNPLLSMLTND